MNVREAIKKELVPLAGDLEVTDIRIGLGYTAVKLSNGNVGLGFTFHRDVEGGCDLFGKSEPFSHRRATDLIDRLDSSNKIEAALAMAAANAVCNTKDKGFMSGDILDHVGIQHSDSVAMVGHFRPLTAKLKTMCASLNIFEMIDKPAGDLFPQNDIFSRLPHCQVALITATSIINGTIDKILDAAKTQREVAILGPSTPLVPRAFKQTPVTFLSGVVVADPDQILAVVSQGGGMRAFGPWVRKVNLRVR